MQASPVLCEPSYGWGKGPHSKLEKVWGQGISESLAAWGRGVPEPAWAQGVLRMEMAWAGHGPDLPVLYSSETGRCCRELPESPPLAGQHQGKNCRALPSSYNLPTPSKGRCEFGGGGTAQTHWRRTEGSMEGSLEPYPTFSKHLRLPLVLGHRVQIGTAHSTLEELWSPPRADRLL